MEKLTEMANAGVNFSIYGGRYWSSKWHVKATKEDDGIKLEIEVIHPDLQTAIDGVYDKWTASTSKGIRILGLTQIEHKTLNDEIPF